MEVTSIAVRTSIEAAVSDELALVEQFPRSVGERPFAQFVCPLNELDDACAETCSILLVHLRRALHFLEVVFQALVHL